MKSMVLENYDYISNRYSCSQLYNNLLLNRFPLFSLLSFDHVMSPLLKLLQLYSGLCFLSIFLAIILKYSDLNN